MWTTCAGLALSWARVGGCSGFCRDTPCLFSHPDPLGTGESPQQETGASHPSSDSISPLGKLSAKCRFSCRRGRLLSGHRQQPLGKDSPLPCPSAAGASVCLFSGTGPQMLEGSGGMGGEQRLPFPSGLGKVLPPRFKSQQTEKKSSS